MPKVTVIPAKRALSSAQTAESATRRRVAGYARVSTDKDEQQNSYEAQVDYYTNYIQSRPDWDFVAVYTDEGISALNTKKRDGFNNMVADALAGKIDLIVTKSVSRFARNTVDSLSTIRKLKENGTEVYFEKEAIWTFDGKGELLITIMSSLAQEESRSISENVTWGKRKGMADGVISLPWSSFLGYEKGNDGTPIVILEEAEMVRTIYRQFMEGKSYTAIAKWLTSQGIPTPMGKKTWCHATIRNILSNEMYKGAKLLQKTFTTNYLTKTYKVNEGELPNYYIEDSHEPIIHPSEWEAVQVEITRRKALGRPISCQSLFSTKIKCGDCGAWFGSKVWQSNTKYRSIIWRCNDRYKRGECKTSHIKEDDIKAAFPSVFNRFMENRNNLISDCRLEQQILGETTDIDTELDKFEQERDVLDGLVRKAFQDNTDTTALLERHAEAVKRIDELEKYRAERISKSKAIGRFIRTMEKSEVSITTFDESVWTAVVDYAVVGVDGGITFRFKNGVEI